MKSLSHGPELFGKTALGLKGRGLQPRRKSSLIRAAGGLEPANIMGHIVS